jgi:signal transduction histidine kinase
VIVRGGRGARRRLQDRKASLENADNEQVTRGDWRAAKRGGFEAAVSELNCMNFHETFRRDDEHMIGLLASRIAHDFNNRLQSIASVLSLIRKRVAEGRTSDLDPLTEVAERSLVSAGKLAHRLMTVARKSQDQSDNLFQLNDALLSMRDLMRCVVGEGIALQLALSDSATPIRCDSHLLECAMINLVMNSRDAMPRGGIIRIETSRIYSPKGVDDQEYISLCVTDSGSGIPSDVMEKIFEPFFTTKPQGVGTGLGLPMIRDFVDQARGHIEVHSAPQQGTCIKLYLPVTAES